MFLKVATDRSESEGARAPLESCLQAAWDTIDKEVFDNLYKSINARIEACILADGWHTKYWDSYYSDQLDASPLDSLESEISLCS